MEIINNVPQDSGLGDSLFTSMDKINANFAETIDLLEGKEDTIPTSATTQYYRGDKSWQTLDKSTVGLGNVDNTSDANKPISTGTQTALNLKYDKSGGTISGNVSATSFIKVGGSAGLLKTDGTVDTNTYVTTGTSININGVNQNLSANREWRTALGDTGVLSYNGITAATTTTVNIGAASGYIVNNETNPLIPTYTFINYAGETNKTVNTIGTGIATYVMLNSAGAIVFQNTFPTSAQRKSMIYLSKIGHPTGTITTAGNEPDFITSPLAQFRDLFQAFNFVNQGVYASPNGANLTINTSAGSIVGDGINFVADKTNPNTLAISPATPASFFRRTQVGLGGASTTAIDPTNYDNGGAITAIGGGSNNSTIQYIWSVPGLGYIVTYGQTVYPTLNDAIAQVGKENPVIYPSLIRNSILIGVIAINRLATALNNPAQAQFFKADIFGQITGAVGGTSTGTLQTAYNNSLIPQITTTSTLGAVTVKNGTGVNTDNILAGQTGSGTQTFGVDGNGLVKATGFVNILSPSTGAWLANGQVLANPIAGTGTTGQVSFWNGTGTQGGNTGFTWDNTNKALVISNSGTSDATVNVTNGTGGQSIGIDSTGSFISSSKPYRIIVGGTARHFFLDNGNYGLSVPTPLAKLHTAGDGTNIIMQNQNNGTTASPISRKLAWYSTNSVERASIDAPDSLTNTNGVPLIFSTRNTANVLAERMRIDNLGNFGYGTDTPVGRFNVVTHVSANTFDMAAQEDGSISFANAGTLALPVISSKSSANTGLLVIAGTDESNATADMRFDVRKNNGSDFTGFTSSAFKFTRGGTAPNQTLVDILRNGAMGVGTTTPTGAFTVATPITKMYDLVSQTVGSISFASSSNATSIPMILGKTTGTANQGLYLMGASSENNSFPDMTFDVRENDNTDYTGITSSGFRFQRFSNPLVDILRNGKVGIGTSTPDATLSVVPAVNHTVGGEPTLRICEATGNELYGLGLSSYSNGSEYVGKLQSKHANAPSPLLLNPEGGNVGIGVASPTLAKLQIEGTVSDVIVAKNLTATGVSAINGTSSNGVYGLAMGACNPSFVTSTSFGASGDTFIRGSLSSKDLNIINTSNTNGNIKFLTSLSAGAPVERMRIMANGNVGMGTDTPTAKLEINTGSALSFDILNQTDGSIAFGNLSTSQVPSIVGKSTNSRGLFLMGGTSETNAQPDFELNVRKNTNVDFTGFTSTAFRFTRFSTTLIDVLRNGDTTFAGNITLSNMTSTATTRGINVDSTGKLVAGPVVTPITEYTPTFGSANLISGLTNVHSYYQRSGNFVTVTNNLSATGTSGGLIGFLTSLPIARISTTGSIGGSGSLKYTAGANQNQVAPLSVDIWGGSNNSVGINHFIPYSGACTLSFSYTYSLL